MTRPGAGTAGSCTLDKDPTLLDQQDATEVKRKKRQAELNENISHSKRENAGEVYYDGNDDRSNH